MEQTIKAIETVYKGYRFRSRLEARWAVFFDALGVTWEYEKEGFELDGIRYLPDFYIPCLSSGFQLDAGGFVEIKPRNEYQPYTSIYLAGKIANTDWRSDLCAELFRRYERFTISGPDNYITHDGRDENIVDYCLRDITSTDYILANIDTKDSPGTLIELGFGIALKKNILIRYDTDELAEYLWFARGARCNTSIIEYVGGNMADMFTGILPPLTTTFDKCRKLSKNKRVILMQGDPMDTSITMFGHGVENDWGVTNLAHMCSLFMGVKESKVKEASQKARSARFEFGEKG